MFKESKRVMATDTLIGQGTIAEGKLTSEANLRIEGEYRGDIVCRGDVIVGECGVVRSNIEARDVTLAGKLYGDIVTTGRLIITSSGQLTGSITAHSLIIQDGGIINGTCQMQPQQPDQKQRASAADSDNARYENKQDVKADQRVKSRQAV